MDKNARYLLQLAIALIGTLLLAGCKKNAPVVDKAEIPAICMQKTMYQADGMYSVKGDRIFVADWENLTYNIICDDLFCNHQNNNCAAFVDAGNDDLKYALAFKYKDKLMILITKTNKIEGNAENTKEPITVKYNTVVYEADLNGKNRKKVCEFVGGSEFSTKGSAFLDKDMLYIGGATGFSLEIVPDAVMGITEKYKYTTACFAIDLKTYKVETFGCDDMDDVKSFTVSLRVGDTIAVEKRGLKEGNKRTGTTLEIFDKDYKELFKKEYEGNIIILKPEDGKLYYKDSSGLHLMDDITGEEELIVSAKGGLDILADGFITANLDMIDGKTLFTKYDFTGKEIETVNVNDLYAAKIIFNGMMVITDGNGDECLVDLKNLKTLTDSKRKIEVVLPEDQEEEK